MTPSQQLPHSCIHKRKLPPSITTRTFSKSALKSLRPIKMVRFHYRLHAMKNRLSRALGNHCFGFALRSYTYIPKHADNTFTSHVLHCLSYAYKLITWILFILSDSQYLKLEGDGVALIHIHKHTHIYTLHRRMLCSGATNSKSRDSSEILWKRISLLFDTVILDFLLLFL